MNKNLATADYIVFILYFIIVAGYGYSVYRKRKKNEHDAKAYFLAEGTLTWWAIGASLIASNISAEQFIGMSGEGFFLGIAVAAQPVVLFQNIPNMNIAKTPGLINPVYF